MTETKDRVSSLAARPDGDGEYVVQQGECMGSIAYRHGFLWQTLWNHPANAALKRARRDPRVLLPEDRVHIPERQQRIEEGATERRHCFVRKGVPEHLRIVLLDPDGNPRANLPYTLVVARSLHSGTTDENGVLAHRIPADAREGELLITQSENEERYSLQIGSLDPADAASGFQARLHNLGYRAADSHSQHAWTEALRSFQEHRRMDATGIPNDHAKKVLVRDHGF